MNWDKFITASLVIAVLGWLANGLYESMQEKMDQNRDSIQALIQLHLNGL